MVSTRRLSGVAYSLTNVRPAAQTYRAGFVPFGLVGSLTWIDGVQSVVGATMTA